MASIPEGVGATALLTAYARAEESGRPDRLFDDPLARAFIEEAVGIGPRDALPRMGMARTDGSSELWRAFSDYFVGRTPFYDRHLLAAVERGVRQVVILAAGMDSRAFRVALPPDTTVYELDSAPVLDFKEQVLRRRGASPVCRRVTLPVDLRTDWVPALTAAGLDRDAPVAWLLEGLIMYLNPTQSDRLLAMITTATRAGGTVLTEYHDRVTDMALFTPLISDDADRAAARSMAGMVVPGPDPNPIAWLRRHGWYPAVTEVATELAVAGRELPPILGSDTRLTAWLLAGVLPAGVFTD
jgi:methyltransferase (TIGR00027 family)